MADVEIYTRAWCGYCHRAKRLLTDKGVAFRELAVDTDAARRQEMVQRAGGRTSVPQIFIDGEHIGGCDELLGLERAGALDPKLAG
ncbi:MAG: glutaredoxin 3 [Rhodothalassiaceae bacterium]